MIRINLLPDEYRRTATILLTIAHLEGEAALLADEGWRQAERFFFLPARFHGRLVPRQAGRLTATTCRY